MEELGLASGQKRPHSRAIRESLTSRGNVLLVFIETRRWPHPERLYVGALVGDISSHRANSPTINVLSRACSWPVGATTSCRIPGFCTGRARHRDVNSSQSPSQLCWLACGRSKRRRIYSRTVGAARSADIYLQRRTGWHMDWVGRVICRALHIAVMLLRINAEAQSLLSPRARDGHSADNLPRKRSCRPD